MSLPVSGALQLIKKYCQKNEWPLLDLIVVSKSSGRPSLDGDADVPKAQAEVFAYGWTNREDHSGGVPTIEDFEQIVAA